MKLDLKTLAIGILLGICVTLAMAQRRAEPPQKLDADYRYQISVSPSDGGVYVVWVLDHETQKIHTLRTSEAGRDGVDLKSKLQGR